MLNHVVAIGPILQREDGSKVKDMVREATGTSWTITCNQHLLEVLSFLCSRPVENLTLALLTCLILAHPSFSSEKRLGKLTQCVFEPAVCAVLDLNPLKEVSEDKILAFAMVTHKGLSRLGDSENPAFDLSSEIIQFIVQIANRFDR